MKRKFFFDFLCRFFLVSIKQGVANTKNTRLSFVNLTVFYFPYSLFFDHVPIFFLSLTCDTP